MSRFDGKIAVFICGPVRYVSLVSKRLEEVLTGYEYDCFYHLWKTDLGNKVRQQEETNPASLLSRPRTKVMIHQEPYSVEDFREAVGTETRSGSTINATMGMFFSVSTLCHYLALLPDVKDYSHVLRLRTDCAILTDELVTALDPEPNVLTVSQNCHVPEGRISDHIAFAARELFFRVWKFEQMSDIYACYEAGGRNPEAALAIRLGCLASHVCLNPAMVRFRDYHIIRFPPRDTEPKWIAKALNELGISGFFTNSRRYFDPDETAAYMDFQQRRCRAFAAIQKAIQTYSPQEAFAGMSPAEIASALTCVADERPDLSSPVWNKIYPCLGATALEQMLRKCEQLAAEYAKGTAWLSKVIECQLRPCRLYALGYRKLCDGAYEEAVSSLQEALSHRESFPNINYALATAYAQMGRFGTAKYYCGQELLVQPEHKQAASLMARLEDALRSVHLTIDRVDNGDTVSQEHCRSLPL